MKRSIIFGLLLSVTSLTACPQGRISEAISRAAGASCPAPTPMNTPLPTASCANFTGQTCLDATFGDATQLPPGGLVVTNSDGAVPGTVDSDGAAAVKQQQQSDGSSRYVAIGQTTNPTSTSIHGVNMIRYNLDGSLDTTFGSGGILKYFSPSNVDLSVHDGTIDSAGNILAVGVLNNSSMTVLRFTPGGVLDSTFNSVGFLTLSNFTPFAMLLQADGKILVGGITYNKSGAQIGLVVRVNANGTLDATFGSNGQVAISSFYYLEALALQTVGSQQYILAGGGSGSGTTEKFTVVRLTPTGSLDSSFGASGVATTSFCGDGSRIMSLSVDLAGNILAGGRNYLVVSGHAVFALARFAINGALDTTFGNSSTPGKTILDFFASDNHLTSIQPVLDSGGNELAFLAGGWVIRSVGSNTYKYFAIAQYHPVGTLDTTFGTNGGAVIDFGHQNNYTNSPSNNTLLIQADGRIVMAGTASFSSGPYNGYNFALTRLWP